MSENLTLKELPLPGELITVQGCSAFLIPAPHPAEGAPWVWYAPTLPSLPGSEERWMFERWQEAGIAIAGIDVGESFGSPKGRALYTALYEYLVQQGFSTQACLLARSRGGMMQYNWAVEHPDWVACVAAIYPICNMTSFPGIARMAPMYELSAEELTQQLNLHNPIERLQPLAAARVPLYHIHGDADQWVPLALNSGTLAERYRALGGKITLNVIAGGGHDMEPHWFQCQELVDFVVANCRR
ncbi:MAG: alpha/beta hydrolase family protein [Anaerolineae bacterium]